MAGLLSFFRLPNLLIVLLCQGLPYWWALRPALLQAGAVPALTTRTFGLLTLATVLTTLSGYLINDVFDAEKDRINRPRRTVIGRWLPPWLGVLLYLVVLGAAMYAGVQLGRELPPEPGTTGWSWPYWLFPTVAVLLFMYAWQLKCTALAGNLLVSALCALVPLLLLWSETRPIALARDAGHDPVAVESAVALVWMYALFGFATTLLREQIKTMQDVEGDAACGCMTFPVQKGLRVARFTAIATGLGLLLLVLLALMYWQQQGFSPMHLVAGTILLFLPVILVLGFLLGRPDKPTFRRASLLVKIVMLAGIFLLLPRGQLAEAGATIRAILTSKLTTEFHGVSHRVSQSFYNQRLIDSLT